MAIEHWLRLAMTDGIGPILIQRIIDATGSAQAACDTSVAELRMINGIGTSKASTIRHSMSAAPVEEEMARCKAMGVAVICPDDEVYPAMLKEIPDPPPVLYLKGDLQPRDLNAVAIVGSRKCSFYGREQAERFAALLAGAGFTVISGGARGIDSSAHRGAMSHRQGARLRYSAAELMCPIRRRMRPCLTRLQTMAAAPSSANIRWAYPRSQRIFRGGIGLSAGCRAACLLLRLT